MSLFSGTTPITPREEMQHKKKRKISVAKKKRNNEIIILRRLRIVLITSEFLLFVWKMNLKQKHPKMCKGPEKSETQQQKRDRQ